MEKLNFLAHNQLESFHRLFQATQICVVLNILIKLLNKNRSSISVQNFDRGRSDSDTDTLADYSQTLKVIDRKRRVDKMETRLKSLLKIQLKLRNKTP